MRQTRVRRRQGFTLMEITIALTITAVVATLAASALHAALDVRERVQQHRLTLDAESRATTWIATMLRHPPPASAVDEPMLTITRNSTGNATATFLSQGVESPAGAGTIWRVTISVETDGLHLHAVPATSSGSRIPLETVLPHIDRLDVEALETSGTVTGQGATHWRTDWPVLRSMPTAVRITLGSQMPIVFPVAPLSTAAVAAR